MLTSQVINFYLMKKLLFILVCLFVISSCTDVITQDDEVVLQTFAIDKDDVVTPGGNGCPNPNDPNCGDDDDDD